MLDKLKQNKIWLTVIAFGIIIVIILLMMLNQQKQNSPAAQESSYSSSVKASSSSAVDQDKANEKAYAKKAATMKGHVLDGFITSWSKDDFRKWAKEYSSLSDSDKHRVKSNLGTSKTFANNEIAIDYLSNYADSVNQNDFESISYFDTVKEFNKKHPAINPDDLK
ncbi:hypothetical protein [Leuconostoc citreum]|uniref:hypothetical protein n=1 Tax=Leuconostoc citreum TaxID=33964 RepID=UPI0032DF7A21